MNNVKLKKHVQRILAERKISKKRNLFWWNLRELNQFCCQKYTYLMKTLIYSWNEKQIFEFQILIILIRAWEIQKFNRFLSHFSKQNCKKPNNGLYSPTKKSSELNRLFFLVFFRFFQLFRPAVTLLRFNQ